MNFFYILDAIKDCDYGRSAYDNILWMIFFAKLNVITVIKDWYYSHSLRMILYICSSLWLLSQPPINY